MMTCVAGSRDTARHGGEYRVRVDRMTHSGLTDVSGWRSWLHASADDEVLAARHGILMSLLLVAAALTAVASIFAVLAMGASVTALATAILFTLAPLAIAAFLTRTGRLDAAHVGFAAQLALLVVFATILSGGSASFTIVWLALLPTNGLTGHFFRDRKPIPW